VITLGAVKGEPRGASWGDENTIVFAIDDGNTGLWRISAEGGEATVLTTPDAAKREVSRHFFPECAAAGVGCMSLAGRPAARRHTCCSPPARGRRRRRRALRPEPRRPA
jgi:hypothetical protein